MKVVRAAVHVVGEVMITAAMVMFLFVAWQLWWTDVTTDQAQVTATNTLQQQWSKDPNSAPGALVNGKVVSVPLGDAFALIYIPRFGKRYVKPIYQGTELSILDKGVGHYVGTQMPGQIGNYALAGHRVTYGKPFNEIATLKVDDPIVIETANTWYVYRVVGHNIVAPSRVDVVAPVPNHPGQKPTQAWLTMTACHPEFSARERYVVFSQLDQVIPKAKGEVPSVLAGIRIGD
jgi:sortase A